MNDHDYRKGNAVTSISRDDMAAHISAGRARPWTTHQLGRDRRSWIAAEMDGIWWVVFEDDPEVYKPAPEQVSAFLTQAQTRLAAASQMVAEADARTEPLPSGLPGAQPIAYRAGGSRAVADPAPGAPRLNPPPTS